MQPTNILRKVRNFTNRDLRISTVFLCLSCTAPHLVCLCTAYLHTYAFCCAVYLHIVPSATLRTSSLCLLLRCVPPHLCLLLCCVPPHLRLLLRCVTLHLHLLLRCVPLNRARLSVLQCATNYQIHRSDHMPKRSRLSNRSTFKIYIFHLDIDLAFQTDHPKFQILRYSNFTSD